jgi:transcriptional regulator with XRE-family HTH domain
MEMMKAVYDAREQQNLTQKELARRSGVQQSDISKIENGTRNPSIKLLRKIAHGLNMKLEIRFIPNA